MRRVALRGTSAVVLAAAAVVAGCGASTSGSGVAQLGTATSSDSTTTQGTQTNASQQDFQAAVLAYTKCLRGQGLDVPDPTFGAGSNGGGLLLRRSGNTNTPKFRKAQAKCRPILASVRPQFSPADRQKFQDASLEFARCMRNNGVDVPDPDFSQQGPGRGGGGLFGASGLNPNDPKVKKAAAACRHVFTDAGLGNGRFGGPPAARP